VWHIVDYELVPLEKASSLGQFYSRDTYVIRWEYRVTVTGRDLKGQASNHGVLGRDRYCYFLWIGAQAPPADQGASALNTRELDEERGPQMRILQGHEPPAFISLFQGSSMFLNCFLEILNDPPGFLQDLICVFFFKSGKEKETD